MINFLHFPLNLPLFCPNVFLLPVTVSTCDYTIHIMYSHNNLICGKHLHPVPHIPYVKCLLQLCVVTLAAVAHSQQFNSSPTHSVVQHHVTFSRDTRTDENQKQKFQLLSVPIQQNHFPSRELRQIGSTQAFQHRRQNSAAIQERFQQPPQSQTNEGTVFLTTARSINAPFQQVSSQEQTFQTVPFPPSQQAVQPSSSSSAQQQIPVPVQQTKRPVVQAQDQTFQTTNQRSVQIKATSVQKTVHQAQQLQNAVQQTSIPLHQQQPAQGATKTPPSFAQTFNSQQFSTQTQPTSFQMQNSQQETVNESQSTQLQQQQRSQKKTVHNQQLEDVTTLSPEEELFQEQARNAKYSFDSTINDNIMDNNQVRQEKRNGLVLTGLYSYSDGFYKRTVHYKADEHGYRVTK